MYETYLGSTPEAALRFTRSLYPDAHLQTIDGGQENLVIIADEKFTVRFPRSEAVWLQGESERAVLRYLSSYDDMPVPRIISISETPAYMVTKYLRGNQITTRELRSLPTETLERVGAEIARFSYQLHSRLDVARIEPLLQLPSWSYDAYIKRVLYEETDPNPKVDALAKEYFHKWQAKHIPSRRVVIHDDLHTGNLLFTESYALAGVLDFGSVRIGAAEQDLRQTYRLGEAGFEAAMSTYESLSGIKLDRELAKMWTVTQELASYCREDNPSVHERAAENLQFWFLDLFI